MVRNNDTFRGSFRTKRGSYKEFNELRALWFEDGIYNNFRIDKQKIKGTWYFVLMTGDYDKILWKHRIN